jgi:hypothetical protein
VHSRHTDTDAAVIYPGDLQVCAEESERLDAHTRLHKPLNGAACCADDCEKRQIRSSYTVSEDEREKRRSVPCNSCPILRPIRNPGLHRYSLERRCNDELWNGLKR